MRQFQRGKVKLEKWMGSRSITGFRYFLWLSSLPSPASMSSFVCLTIYVAHSFLPASLSAGTRLAAVQLDRDLLWGPSRAVSSPVSQTLRVYTASIGEEAGDSGGRKG